CRVRAMRLRRPQLGPGEPVWVLTGIEPASIGPSKWTLMARVKPGVSPPWHGNAGVNTSAVALGSRTKRQPEPVHGATTQSRSTVVVSIWVTPGRPPSPGSPRLDVLTSSISVTRSDWSSNVTWSFAADSVATSSSMMFGVGAGVGVGEALGAVGELGGGTTGPLGGGTGAGEARSSPPTTPTPTSAATSNPTASSANAGCSAKSPA